MPVINSLRLETVLGPKFASSTPRPSNYIDGRKFGLIPDTGRDLTQNLQDALTAGRIDGRPVRVMPGKYIYSNLINNCGGGLVCTQGEAWFD